MSLSLVSPCPLWTGQGHIRLLGAQKIRIGFQWHHLHLPRRKQNRGEHEIYQNLIIKNLYLKKEYDHLTILI
jgi:hypothetical protein